MCRAASPLRSPGRKRTPAVEELGETFPKQEAGSQWGVVSLVAAAASIEARTYVQDPLGQMVKGPVTTSLEGIAGLGARYGLRKRVADTRLLIPGIAVMAGAASLGSGGGAAGLIAVPAALGIIAIVLAGRVEVRYTARPVSGSGTDCVSIMLGAGT